MPNKIQTKILTSTYTSKAGTMKPGISVLLVTNAVTWLVALHVLSHADSEPARAMKFVVTLASLGHLAIETHEKYAPNGKWLVIHILAISAFFWGVVAISGVCLIDVAKMCILVQGSAIAGRYTVDVCRTEGAAQVHMINV